MLSLLRRCAPFGLALWAGLLVGCSSHNQGIIEGKWKVVALPEGTDAESKTQIEELEKRGFYVYLEFKNDGVLLFGLGADTPERLAFFKAVAPDQKIDWEMKYRLLSGEGVEVYDQPGDARAVGGSLFGTKERGRVTVKITGDDMTLVADTGTLKLTKMK
jgi:hypothetical protein